MVGAGGLEPPKAVRPRDLQSLAIAAMRYARCGSFFQRGTASVLPRTRFDFRTETQRFPISSPCGQQNASYGPLTCPRCCQPQTE